MSEIINLTKDKNNEKNTQHKEDHDGFQSQKRQGRTVNKRIGTATVNGNDTGFAGEERRVWLYIYRVKPHVNAEMIKKFITKKSDYEHLPIEVRQLSSMTNRSKWFVVTAPLSRKDEMYNTDFWPMGVGIKRFDFFKHRDYLQESGADFLA